ncbi:hypothetical protein P389DRAFT_198721 [Cystobasidium minutum MCA 4210]|uniref:uncharacterized protein n=1 Tax=Cystobasidium minutum MCA 4210 TaxID=1397322 RepID=UPI0034CDFE84|eukprot:jgi/Rhomi1/198721/gm1.6935_g
MNTHFVLISYWLLCCGTLVDALYARESNGKLALVRKQWGGSAGRRGGNRGQYGAGASGGRDRSREYDGRQNDARDERWGNSDSTGGRGDGTWHGGRADGGWGNSDDEGGRYGSNDGGWGSPLRSPSDPAPAPPSAKPAEPEPAPAPAPAPAPVPAQQTSVTQARPAPSSSKPVEAAAPPILTSKHVITLPQSSASSSQAVTSSVAESTTLSTDSEDVQVSETSSVLAEENSVAADETTGYSSYVELSESTEVTLQRTSSFSDAVNAESQEAVSSTVNDIKNQSKTDPGWYVTSQDFALGTVSSCRTMHDSPSLLAYSVAILIAMVVAIYS